jgi:hypothetical protein
MSEKLSLAPTKIQAKAEKGATLPRPPQREGNRRVWLWAAVLIGVGVVVLIVVSTTVSMWVKNSPLTQNAQPTPPPITTLNVGRTAHYAGLMMTVVKAQDAAYFADDQIRPGPAVVRLTLVVSNPTPAPVGIVYYDVARLLAPRLQPIAPTFVQLPVAPAPGKSITGWLDFPVPQTIALSTLRLQLGSTALGESLVTIPFTGPFSSSSSADSHVPQTLVIDYDYYGHLLLYALVSVDVRYAYQGSQSKAGQQFYVLNFVVSNPAHVDVSPGFGFDYVRLVLNGTNVAPIDNSLPYTFKANAKNVGGHTVFAAPAGLKTLTIGFLSQNGTGQQNVTVTL